MVRKIIGKYASCYRISLRLIATLLSFSALDGSVTKMLAEESPSGSKLAPAGLPKNVVVATVPVGSLASYGVVSPDNATVYVSNFGSNTVSVIDTATNTVTSTISVGKLPSGLAITPDGSSLYVANNGDGTVSVIDPSSNTVTSTVNVGSEPVDIALTPDGESLYVPFNFGITIIDTATNQVSKRLSTSPARADGLVFSPNGRYAYALAQLNQPYNGYEYPSGFLRITTGSGQLKKFMWGTIKLPSGLAISLNGQELYYLKTQGSGKLEIYDIATGTQKTIRLSGGVAGGELAITPDGEYLYFPYGGEILMLSTSTDKIIGNPISVGGQVQDVIIAPDGQYAYGVNEFGYVSVIDISPQ